MSQADIAVVGLAVMGENLALNMEGHGFTVAVFNRTIARVSISSTGESTTIFGSDRIRARSSILWWVAPSPKSENPELDPQSLTFIAG